MVDPSSLDVLLQPVALHEASALPRGRPCDLISLVQPVGLWRFSPPFPLPQSPVSNPCSRPHPSKPPSFSPPSPCCLNKRSFPPFIPLPAPAPSPTACSLIPPLSLSQHPIRPLPPFPPPLPPRPPNGGWPYVHGCQPIPPEDGPAGRGSARVSARARAYGVGAVVWLGPPATRTGLRWRIMRGLWQ